MASTITKTTASLEAKSYETFRGLDSSKDITVLETGKKQALATLENAYCDWRGQITRDRAATRMYSNAGPIKHVNFYKAEGIAWAEYHDAGVSLNSDNGHTLTDQYAAGTIITSVVFNGRLNMLAKGYVPQSYDGLTWQQNSSSSEPKPGFGTAIARRLVTAGYADDPTMIRVSRVDDENMMPADEDPASTDVLRAAEFTVRNIIGTADEITGLGTFENTRLAVFTSDQTLIYTFDANLTLWAIDEKANVNVGTISHNTIQRANRDLLFCSRDGVHAIRRSSENGTTIFSLPMSFSIDLLYHEFLLQTPDTSQITASYDAESGQYNIFFPITSTICKRLTATFNPADQSVSWSSGNFLNARCGAYLAGKYVFGAPGGPYEARHHAQPTGVGETPAAVIETPMLWHGDVDGPKQSKHLTIMASGEGSLLVEAFNETGKQIDSFNLTIEQDDVFPSDLLKQQYKHRFEHRYRGVQLRFTTSGEGLLRISGFSIGIAKG